MKVTHILRMTLFSTVFTSGIYADQNTESLAKAVQNPIVTESIVAEEVPSWSFELSPYLAMSSISGTSAIGRPAQAEIDLDFDQIADALEFGLATHFEALHNNRWGLWLDYNYVSLGGSQSAPLGNNTLKVDIKQAVFEGLGMYRQTLSDGTMDYMAGVRSWRMKVTTDFLTRRKVDENWVDFIVGARWTQNLSENWKFTLRGDIGAGDSDFTATAAVGLRYNINEYLDIDMQYKALWVDYESGTPQSVGHFKYDTVTYGPIVGLNFKF